uniref:Kinesin light chain n=1 Tax=Ditylum brightwellii TaxID=49249 RepID=A0A7S4UX92_9STRA
MTVGREKSERKRLSFRKFPDLVPYKIILTARIFLRVINMGCSCSKACASTEKKDDKSNSATITFDHNSKTRINLENELSSQQSEANKLSSQDEKIEQTEASDVVESIKFDLNSETKKNLENLQGLTRARNNTLRIAEEVLPRKYMNRYPSFSRAPPGGELRQLEGKFDDLLSECENVLPTFRQTLINIVEAAGLVPDEIAVWDGKEVMLTPETPYKSLTIGPLKSRERCDEKVANEYDGDYSRLVDIVRASIVVADEDQLILVAEALQDLDIVRLKNRFKEPVFTGYCDALYNVNIDGIICEVQLHVSAIVAYKEESHHYYGFFRSFFAGNVPACKNRIDMLERCIDPNADLQTALEEMLKTDDEYLIRGMCVLVYEMGDWYLCEVLCRRMCEIDPDELACKNNMAVALNKQGKYVQAEALYRQCWEVRKKTLGEDHPETLYSLNGMAVVLFRQGNYVQAEALHRQCWEVQKKTLGEHHPETLHSLNGMANALSSQGKAVLGGEEEDIGGRSPTMSKQRHCDYVQASSVGRCTEALHRQCWEVQKKQCWEVRKKTLGEDHPAHVT